MFVLILASSHITHVDVFLCACAVLFHLIRCKTLHDGNTFASDNHQSPFTISRVVQNKYYFNQIEMPLTLSFVNQYN